MELARRKSNPVEFKSNGNMPTPVVINGALPERHEPDGGEDGARSPLDKTEADEDWSDWEAEGDDNHEDSAIQEEIGPNSTGDSNLLEKKSERTSPVKVVKKPFIESDLSALEIQVKSRDDEIDYFADMQPTITSAPAVFAPAAVSLAPPVKSDGLDFNVQSQEEKDEDDGWNWDD